MATPLQAQMIGSQMMGNGNQAALAQQSRQALRRPQANIQSAAPADPRALMAMRNQVVPQFQQTQSPAARLQEIDKIKYTEALKAQQNAQVAQRYRDDRVHTQRVAEGEINHQNALKVAQQGYENDLNLKKAQVQIDMDRKRLETLFADKKYADLRAYVGNIFTDFNNWLKTGRDDFVANRTNQLFLDVARTAGITPQMVQERYRKNMEAKGLVTQGEISGELYDQYMREMLLENPANAAKLATISSTVAQEAARMSANKTAAYKAASDKVRELGFSMNSGEVPLQPGPGQPGPNDRRKIGPDELPETSTLIQKPEILTAEQRAEFFEKFPEADTNSDGVLTQAEVEAFASPLGAKDVGVIGPTVNYALDTVDGMVQAIADNPGIAAQIGVGTIGFAGIADYVLSMTDNQRRKLQLTLQRELNNKTRFSDTKTKTKTVTEPPKKPLSKAEKIKINDRIDFLNDPKRKAFANANNIDDSAEIRKLEKKLQDAKSTKVTVDTKEPKKLPAAARKMKQRRIAPKVMERLAKDMGLSKAELNKLDFKNMKVEDFSEMVAKQKGGVITSLKRQGLKILPTKNGGGIDMKKLTDNRLVKGGLMGLGVMGILDLISWAKLPDQTEAKKAKKMVEAMQEANKLIDENTGSLIDANEAEIAELEAELGQEDNSSTPLVPVPR